jgi:hypothetical protein
MPWEEGAEQTPTTSLIVAFKANLVKPEDTPVGECRAMTVFSLYNRRGSRQLLLTIEDFATATTRNVKIGNLGAGASHNHYSQIQC